MMAYVTLEDDTAAIEMLAFSNVLSQFGGYLKENQAVVITGRLSMRDDKEPQIVINRARPISDFASAEIEPAKQVLYLRLDSEQSPNYRAVKASLQMFPGDTSVVLYFADTGVKRGTRCALDDRLLQKLKELLGEGNIVLK
jgi:DNA polymerase-3 subunit alpha